MLDVGPAPALPVWVTDWVTSVAEVWVDAQMDSCSACAAGDPGHERVGYVAFDLPTATDPAAGEHRLSHPVRGREKRDIAISAGSNTSGSIA